MEDMTALLNYDTAFLLNRLVVIEYFKRSDEIARVYRLIDQSKPFSFKGIYFYCFHIFSVVLDKTPNIREFERNAFGVMCQAPRPQQSGSFDLLIAIYNIFQDPDKPVHIFLLDPASTLTSTNFETYKAIFVPNSSINFNGADTAAPVKNLRSSISGAIMVYSVLI